MIPFKNIYMSPSYELVQLDKRLATEKLITPNYVTLKIIQLLSEFFFRTADNLLIIRIYRLKSATFYTRILFTKNSYEKN